MACGLNEKEKINIYQIKFLMNYVTLMKEKVQQSKKMFIRWQNQTKLSHTLDGKKIWQDSYIK